MLQDVDVSRLDPRRFSEVLDPDGFHLFVHRLEEAAGRLSGRRLWHVNSTAQGGGVAEMLHVLLGYLAGAGIDTRWVVISGGEEFFEVTKRIHNRLHGQPGDKKDLGEPERAVYEEALAEPLQELEQRVGQGDVVFLHDPQTAALASPLKRLGASVIWSCHVGVDRPNDLARTAWDFLRPHVGEADAYIFSRPAYRWEGLSQERLASSLRASMPSPPRTRSWSSTRSARSCRWRGSLRIEAGTQGNRSFTGWTAVPPECGVARS